MLGQSEILGACGGPALLVLAAGMGSRFGGLKQISPLGPSGETVLEYSVFDAVRAGFSRVIFVIRKDFEAQFRQQLGSRFEGRIDVDYAFQDLDDLPAPFRRPEGRTKPWGTAHAVLAARKAIDTPFAVINADDFYGADAYRQLAAFLKPQPQTGLARFCMVAYELGRTLSEHGTVSRGICRCGPDGMLLSITEMEKIRMGASGPEALRADSWETLPADTPVSMNMMGFTPALFAMLEERFKLFLAERVSQSGAECYLPEAVTFAVARGMASVKVLRSNGEWMGITYPEDKAPFKRKISAKHSDMQYPSPIWPQLIE
ncbi:MAG: sugar phosphate nucleotidyltransferase [Opitutales bacterium]|jgi:hypothetical protein